MVTVTAGPRTCHLIFLLPSRAAGGPPAPGWDLPGWHLIAVLRAVSWRNRAATGVAERPRLWHSG
jgi:hypothetical protein